MNYATVHGESFGVHFNNIGYKRKISAAGSEINYVEVKSSLSQTG